MYSMENVMKNFMNDFSKEDILLITAKLNKMSIKEIVELLANKVNTKTDGILTIVPKDDGGARILIDLNKEEIKYILSNLSNIEQWTD